MKSGKHPQHRLVWGIVLFLTTIGIAIVIRRTLFLIPVLQHRYEPTPLPQGVPAFPENGFLLNPLLTLIHILPGFLFVVLGPFQFVKGIRSKWPLVHRWMGRVVLASALTIGISGMVMGFKMSTSGISETAATTLFGTFFLYSMMKGFLCIRRRNTILHREWMIRTYAVGLAVTTTRPIVGVFFATSSLTGLTPQDFFGTALWIGFTLHLICSEAWINYTR